MYLRILRKDLKRKRTMNAIVLIFIVLAAMFIASSANNLITIVTALDKYFEIAEVPDYWYATPYMEEGERFEAFAEENGYGLHTAELIQIDPRDIMIDGTRFEYSNSVVLSTVEGTKVFDKDGNEITHVDEGEIYVTAEVFASDNNNFYEGCKIVIDLRGGIAADSALAVDNAFATGGNFVSDSAFATGGNFVADSAFASDGSGSTHNGKKEFTLRGYTKDALFGSPMIGMTRFLVSENDLALFDDENRTRFVSLAVYTEDDDYSNKFNDFNLKSTMNVDHSGIKMMYIMDTLIAAVVFVVSICLILISMVILRFTIQFTMTEEFREIGVMKAIGIPGGSIRGLYIIKYLAISVMGAAIGLALSFPFGSILMESVSKNIMIPDGNQFYLNVICAVGTAAVVVFFCYSCTGKIRKFSPIDAIRNGETGERYSRKSLISLSKSVLKPVPFMAVNDILSGLKKYLSMILIFTLGILLVTIPVNTINTLQSEKLLVLFNMANCDLVISQELLFSSSGQNEDMIREKQEEVRKVLRENNIEAEVFQEIMFRFNISHEDRKSSSLAFQGYGGVAADSYAYLEGTPPQNRGEIAISFITADKLNVKIGDEVEIEMGGETRKYMVTAINQSMNNLGEGIRLYQEEEIDYRLAMGSFGIQILYTDHPDSKTFEARRELLKEVYSDTDVYTAGEYIGYMIGDAAGQLERVKSLILGIILCINILVAVLMVKSFITREKGEIAVLKAIGFRNSSLVAWQSMRIGIVLVVSIVIGTLLSTPLSKILVEPIFRMMGAYRIEFDIIPLEVYVIYPLAVLFATVSGAVLGALQLRKISASATSGIE